MGPNGTNVATQRTVTQCFTHLMELYENQSDLSWYIFFIIVYKNAKDNAYNVCTAADLYERNTERKHHHKRRLKYNFLWLQGMSTLSTNLYHDYYDMPVNNVKLEIRKIVANTIFAYTPLSNSRNHWRTVYIWYPLKKVSLGITKMTKN